MSNYKPTISQTITAEIPITSEVRQTPVGWFNMVNQNN